MLIQKSYFVFSASLADAEYEDDDDEVVCQYISYSIAYSKRKR